MPLVVLFLHTLVIITAEAGVDFWFLRQKSTAVRCHYFLTGPRLPSQPQSVTVLGRCQFILIGKQRHVCVCERLARRGQKVTSQQKTVPAWVSALL